MPITLQPMPREVVHISEYKDAWHEHFVSHLNSKNKKVDVKLEKRNFEHADRVLSEI